ncbi:MAG: acyloxyacyl hydrolase [Gemmatimonadaceae bacterium]
MRQITSAVTACLLLYFGSSSTALSAQDTAHVSGPTNRSDKAATDSGSVHFAKYRKYPWNGYSLWAGGSYETRSASHNEHFDGSMRILAVQISRDVWRGKRTKIAYVGEVLPVMLVRSGPPLSRIPDTLKSPKIYFEPAELNRFKFRDAYGFGLAPFGAEVSTQLSHRTSALFNITAGGLLFTREVPYGAATKPNFTVSPGVALQWEPQNKTRVAIGYTFHHLSNASFGRANPGMNSQILYVRMSRLRRALETR